MTHKNLKCPICGTDVSECPVEHGRIVCPFCFEKINESPETAPSESVEKSPEQKSAESYSVICKICGAVIKYDNKQAGETVICETCNERITLPSLAALAGQNEFHRKSEEKRKTQGYVARLLEMLLQKGKRLLFCYLLTYMAISVVILHWLICRFLPDETVAMFVALGGYFLTLMLLLSPLREVYLRHLFRLSPIRREEDINFLAPLFSNVSEAAARVDPDIPRDVTFYIYESNDINAFATGRKTIAISRGALAFPPRQIEALVAHELGHLSHKDCDMNAIIVASNFIFSVIFGLLRTIAVVIKYILTLFLALLGGAFNSQGTNGQSDMGGCLGFVFGGFLVYIVNSIEKIHWMIYMFCSNRASISQEFMADEFSFNAGYGKDLCLAFDNIARLYGESKRVNSLSFTEMLYLDHPPTYQRIAHLQELGANYEEKRKINKIS